MAVNRIRELEDLFVPLLQQCETLADVKKIHGCIIKHRLSQSNFLVTKMVDACDKAGAMAYANRLFKGVIDPNVFLYNSIIRAYTHHSMYNDAVGVYKLMLKNPESENPVVPDRFTFPFVIKSCAGLGFYELGKQVHGHLFKFRPKFHVVTKNALIDMYTKFDDVVNAHRVFDEMYERDVISWNSLVSGYARLGQMRKARALFCTMPDKTIVSWTAMISGYTKIGSYVDAVDIFRQMQIAGIGPDEISVISVLPSCAHLGALELGKWIHRYSERKGFLKQTGVCNALIEMYSKCGVISQAIQLFDQMHEKDVISWSTMISGFANHGNACEAIETFREMQRTNVTPNGITFLGLLSACAHAGLWKEGLRYFKMMRQDYKIGPVVEHYGCLVDVLARAGQMGRALEIARTMPMNPDSKIWGSLLSACRTHGNLEVALIAMDHLLELEPDDTGNYVLLSNIYADLGMWEGVSGIRKLIRSKSMKKMPGCSLIEVNNVVEEFVARDHNKPYWREICFVLEMFSMHQNVIKNGDLSEIMAGYGNEDLDHGIPAFHE
ncbi:PREDICTED: pentatricopeptide repeat-containing protein At2g20540 [Tarenaya hassleriana]|uniref:pentatricopeptide repeat-containing protein At2g20540 n=1 Tax=Tarenaya hassleriana TaxID=28532 RepID=UPI00053C2D3B|nr:PREDICTED: pentatricopeptide repeat-containing protein At2g20540 [Tarenaya hassleriana]